MTIMTLDEVFEKEQRSFDSNIELLHGSETYGDEWGFTLIVYSQKSNTPDDGSLFSIRWALATEDGYQGGIIKTEWER